MHTLIVYITEEQHKQLKQVYADSGQRLTETVRQAIDLYFKNKKVKNGTK